MSFEPLIYSDRVPEASASFQLCEVLACPAPKKEIIDLRVSGSVAWTEGIHACSGSEHVKTKILVADGSDLVATTLAALATRFGYEIIASVSSGAEALAVAAVEPPHVALIDLHMRGALSGVELAEHLIGMGVRVAVLSCLPPAHATAVAAELNAHALITKPFDAVDFRRGVEWALRSVGRGPANQSS